MNIGFIESFDSNFSEKYNDLDVYCPLLSNLCGNYVKDYFNGFLYVYKGKILMIYYNIFLKPNHCYWILEKFVLIKNLIVVYVY